MKPDHTSVLKILWWNVNRRLDLIVQRISPICTYSPNIVFTTETSTGYGALPVIDGYKLYADTDIRLLNHGGIAVYIEHVTAEHVFDVKYHKCFISLRLDYAPNFIIIGTYIQPESSPYFNEVMFSDLNELLISSCETGLIPIMGGDMNCRYGSLNVTFSGMNLVYNENADVNSNHHGRTYGIDLCTSASIFPLNHLKQKKFTGDFTYYKADKKSQIDFVYTNKAGLKHITELNIPNEDWHLSDHRPIMIDLKTPKYVNCAALLQRAKDLNNL